MSFLCQYIKKQRLDSYNIKRFFIHYFKSQIIIQVEIQATKLFKIS